MADPRASRIARLIAALALPVSFAACGGGGGSASVPVPITTPPSTSTPTALTIVPSGMSVALPAAGGFGGTMTLTPSNAPAGATLQIATSNALPPGASALQSARRIRSLSTPQFYVSLTPSATVTFNGFAGFAITTPSGWNPNGDAGLLAFFDGALSSWTSDMSGRGSAGSGELTFAATGVPWTLPAGKTSVVALYPTVGVARTGAFQGNDFVGRGNGSTFEFSESVALVFSRPLDMTTFSYTVSPSTPVSFTAFQNAGASGTTVSIAVRKLPSTTYTVTIGSGVAATDGTKLTEPYSYTLLTGPAPAPAAPSASKAGVYAYGMVMLPFPHIGLVESTIDDDVNVVASSGSRFARMDFCGAQNEPSANRFDFTAQDVVLDKLAAHNVAVLATVPQYCAPGWESSSGFWTSPHDFAAYAAGVASHIATRYPASTRISFFNEPNIVSGWDPASGSPAASQAAAAADMRAAYAEVKAVAPQMSVVGPELSDGGSLVSDPRDFLTGLYANGCATGSCWDVISVHNTAWENPAFAVAPTTRGQFPERWDIYKDLQSIATAHGEQTPHVMLTEWGISNDPSSPVGYDPSVQATYVATGLNLMLADPTVDGLAYVRSINATNDFYGYTAMTSSNGTGAPIPGVSRYGALPAYSVFRGFATR